MNRLLGYFRTARSSRNPAMREPSGITLESLRGSPSVRAVCNCRQGRDPCTCRGDTTHVDARLNDLRAQRRAIDAAIDSLEIERMLITGEEPLFLQAGAR